MKETVVCVVGYVCMYVCVYSSLCTCVTWLFVCMWVYPSLCTCVCMILCACVCMTLCACVHVCVCAPLFLYMCVHLLCVYVWMCAPLFVCMYIFGLTIDFYLTFWDTICQWTCSSLFWPASARDPPVCCQCWGGRYTTTPSLTWVLGIWTQILRLPLQALSNLPCPQYGFLKQKMSEVSIWGEHWLCYSRE